MKPSLYDSIIRRLFGINGPLDEHRLHVIGQITSKYFIIFYLYLFLLPIAVLLFIPRWPEQTLVAIGVSAFSLLFLTNLLIWREIELHHLSEIEADEENFDKIIKKAKIDAISQGIFQFFFFPIIRSLLNVFEADFNFLADVLSISSLISGLLFGIFMGVTTYAITLSHIKK